MDNVIKSITVDLYSPTSYEVIKAQQGDNNSRIIEFILYNQGEPYTIAKNISIRMEGHRGDGSSFIKENCTVSNNIISAIIDSDILYEHGIVEAKLVMYDISNDAILSTIPFKIHVQKNPCDKNKVESDKKSLIDDILLIVDKAKKALEEHINNFLNPHNVTKAQVGLGLADNTPDIEKNVNSAKKLTTARKINNTLFDGTADITTDKWGKSRTVTLSGDVSGSKEIDGSSNVDISVTVKDNSHEHTVSNISDLTATASELNVLDGITSTTTELNKLHGTTATVDDFNKLHGVTASASELNIMDGVTATTTELNYVDGVTSNIQTQLNSKQPNITGGATTITSSNLTASRALISNSSGKVAVSDVTSTELGYLDGVTSNIQTQLNAKAPLASPTLTGTPKAPTATAGTNSTQIATTAFVTTAVANGIAASDAMIIKGTIGTSGTVTSLPTTYKTGWTYRVVTAGTYAGQVCEIGDLIVALVDRSGSGNLDSDWCVAQTNINGAITGIKSGDAYITTSQSGSVVTITHKDVTRTNTTSTASPTHGGTFTAVKTVTSDAKGHVTGVDTETVTLPTYTALKNPNAISINGKSYDGSSAVNVGTIGAAYGGTGKTSLNDSANVLINSLSTGDDTPSDADYYVAQYAGGGTTTTTYHRRPISALWNYIKSKLATVATSGSYNDLSNKPTIGNGTVTIKQAGTSKGTFTMNQSGNTTIELTDNNTTYGVATQSANGLESAADKKKLDGIATGAEVNQNAFSNVVVGSTTISADSKTDSLTLAGSNVTLTPDATNDKVTIGITKANVTSALGYTPPTTNTTYGVATSSTLGLVKSGTDITVDSSGNVSVNDDSHNHTIANVDGLQTALDGKAVKKELTSENLNDIKTPGFYNAGGSNSVTNKPSGVDHFGLYVVKRASGDYYTQILIDNNKKQYRRHCENGTWGSWAEDKLTDTNTTYSAATTSASGLMTAAMVTKLNGIATGANAYSHPTSSGNKHIPSGGSSGQILRWSADGTAVWGNDNNTTYSNFVKSGSGAKAGLVPAPSTTAGTTKYLREDGTWAVPPDTNTTYTSLKNPYTLTIQGNGTTLTNGTYDGSAAKTVNITPSSIGAAASSHTHSYLPLSGGTMTGNIQIGANAIYTNGGTAYGMKYGTKTIKGQDRTGIIVGDLSAAGNGSFTIIGNDCFTNGWVILGLSGTIAVSDVNAVTGGVVYNYLAENYLPLSGGTMTGNIIPDLASRYLGNSTNRWATIYADYHDVNYIHLRKYMILQEAPATPKIINYATYSQTVYSSADTTETSTSAIEFGSSQTYSYGTYYKLDTVLKGYRLRLNADDKMSTNIALAIASDEKVKSFTEDIETDEEKLIKLFDIIKPKSYTYKYLKSDNLNIGFSAQEIEQAMINLNIDPEKYGILNIQYGHMLSRGNDFEDGKYYTKFYEISYNDLFNLSLLKTHMMEKEHVERLSELEEKASKLDELEVRLSALENK